MNNITLTIKDIHGWPIAQVEAIQVGDLALHKAIYGNRITHVPTLAHITKGLPDGSRAKKDLLRWMAKVQENLKEDWVALAALTPLTYTEVNDNILAVKERVLNHCRSVAL